MHESQLMATAVSKDSLLVMETIHVYAFTSQSIDTLTWHKRLRHINSQYMTKGSIQSVTEKTENLSHEACLKNKSTRVISRKTPVKSRKPLEKIHSDLAGPITPISRGGNKYVITFIDDHS